ncbi:MAG: glycerol-3-phosphate 1-O-acyltransferase PlsY [Pseudomonadota bacterium]
MPDPISWAAAAPWLIGFLLLGYAFGSIPSGLLLTRFAGKGDIRDVGSGNIGATNVLRTGDKKLAAATLLMDALKGVIPVLIAQTYGGPDAAVCAGLGAFLGHLFPVWLGFKGGKGIATYIGLCFAFAWQAALAFALVWLAIAFLSRMSSLAALIATLVVPMVLFVTGHVQQAELFLVLTILAWIAHRANIQRILAGTESRIGSSK